MRRRLLRFHILLAIGWVLLCGVTLPIVTDFSDGFTFTASIVFSGACVGFCLILALSVGALRQRDYVFALITGAWCGILATVGMLTVLLQRDDYQLIFMPIFIFCFLISTTIGRTRGLWTAPLVAAGVAAVITLSSTTSGEHSIHLLDVEPYQDSTVIDVVAYPTSIEYAAWLPSLKPKPQYLRVRFDSAGTPKLLANRQPFSWEIPVDTSLRESPDTIPLPVPWDTGSSFRKLSRSQFVNNVFQISFTEAESDSFLVSIYSRENTCRVKLPGFWYLGQGPVAVGHDIFLESRTGYAFLRCGTPTTIVRKPGWYLNDADTTGVLLIGEPLTVALAQGDRVDAIAPSLQLFSANRDTVFFHTDFFTSYWRRSRRTAVALFFGVWSALLLFPALCGLYRLPVYAVESAIQAGVVLSMTIGRIFILRQRTGAERATTQRRLVLSPLFSDHVSTLPLVGSRRILEWAARSNPIAYSELLLKLLETSKRERLIAQEFYHFHQRRREYLVQDLLALSKFDNLDCLRRLTKRVRGANPVYRALAASLRFREAPLDHEAVAVQVVTMGELAAAGYAHADELQYSLAAFRAFLGYSSLNSLHGAEQQVVALLRIGYSDRLVPGLFNFFEALLEVTRDLSNYSIVEKFRDRQYYLSEARIKLYEVSRKAKDELPAPYQVLGLQVGEQWLRLITREAKSIRGPAELQLTLLTRTVSAARGWQPIVVSVRNSGQSPAENIRISLVPYDQLQVDEAEKLLPVLGTDETREFEFLVQMNDRTGPTLRLNLDAQFDDFERSGKVVPFADMVRISQHDGEFRQVPNPYIVGIPIQSDRVFFGRKGALAFATQNLTSGEQNNAIIFFGQRRVGKSSILYRLMQTDLAETFIFVYVDCQGFADGTTAEVLYSICRRLHQSAQPRGVTIPEPELPRFRVDTFVEMDRYLDVTEQCLGRLKVAVMFDEYEFLEYKVRNGSLSADIFDKLRNLMQHRNRWLALIFAGTHRLTELTQDYWSFLFNTALYYEIGPLALENARGLIIQPVKGYLTYDPLAIEKILRATGMHPYFIQVTCRMLVNHCNAERKNYVTLADVNEILAVAVEGSTAHVKYLFNDYASGHERDVLVLLARATDDVKQTASVDELVQIGHENQVYFNEFEVGEMLSNLAAKKLVRTDGERRGELYAFELDFVRLWIREHVKLSPGGFRLI